MKKIPALFSSAPIRRDYADGADLFRVLCTVLIAWFHIWQQSWLNPNIRFGSTTINIYPVVTCGYMFVDCMILLSGFLLMLGELNGRTRSPKEFYAARAARIVPAYYFFLLIQLAFFILPGSGFADMTSGLIDSLSHLTFTHNLFPEGYTGTRFNGVLWTLAVEVQFYLLFPLIGKRFRKRPLTCWCIMTAMGFLARFYVARYHTDISLFFNRLPAMLDVYANGMMAAVIWVRLSKTPSSAIRAWFSTLLTIAACVCIYRILKHQRTLSDYPAIRQGQMDSRFLLSAAAAILLVASGRSILLVRRLFSNPVTRFLSSISFNFYMWHQFIACRLKEWHIPPYSTEMPNMNSEQPWQTLYTIACFAFAVIISILLTRYIEKPGARFVRKLFGLDKTPSRVYNTNIKKQVKG